MTQAERIIGKWGGRTPMSRDTPYTYAQIRRWEETGFVPSDEHQALIQVAAEQGIEILPYDFVAHLVAVLPRRTESAA